MVASGVRMVVVLNLFPEIVALMPARAGASVAATAQAIAGDAQAICPVDTGALRDSIEAQEVSEEHWQVVAGERYAAYVEYGTRDHGGPQPYMTPAAHNNEPGFVAGMSSAVIGL